MQTATHVVPGYSHVDVRAHRHALSELICSSLLCLRKPRRSAWMAGSSDGRAGRFGSVVANASGLVSRPRHVRESCREFCRESCRHGPERGDTRWTVSRAQAEQWRRATIAGTVGDRLLRCGRGSVPAPILSRLKPVGSSSPLSRRLGRRARPPTDVSNVASRRHRRGVAHVGSNVGQVETLLRIRHRDRRRTPGVGGRARRDQRRPLSPPQRLPW